MKGDLDIQIVVIIFLVGIFGFVCSIISLYLIFNKSDLKNAYGYICGAHSIVEGCTLFIFVSWGNLLILIDKPLGLSTEGIIIGCIVSYCYYNALYLHLLKSLNRFCAIVFSVKYRIWFTINNAKLLLIMLSLISMINVSPFLWYDCNVYFNKETYAWKERELTCAETTAFYVDLVSSSLTMGTALFCDCVTFWYMHFRMCSRLRNDVRFVMQAFSTSLFYFLTIISFYILSHLFSTPFWSFLTTTLAWMLCHTFNQLSFVLFIATMKDNSTKVEIIKIKDTAIEH